MLNYSDCLTRLIADITARVPALSSIDAGRLLVFARLSSRRRHGLLASCHPLTGPVSAGPHVVRWVERRSGRLVRQSEWFEERAPEVVIHGRRIDYLISFLLPRFCDDAIVDAHVRRWYPKPEPWIARLDTVVHELYHIAPGHTGIRRMARADGGPSRCVHGRGFYRDVAALVRAYLETRPDPALLAFLHANFGTLTRRYGGVVATVFRDFPSFPQPYRERVDGPPPPDGVALVRLRRSRRLRSYTERDLCLRQFLRDETRPLDEIVPAAANEPAARGAAAARTSRPDSAPTAAAARQLHLF